ncbi:VOC family protein [Janibacter sp. GS2]|uniref:VOC family protein n=1 Tax=Janibacter sp. GS2 TaxID=3442646 RepID=UPI003EBB221C
MNVLFVAGFAVISSTPGQDLRLFVDTLGLPLRPPTSVPTAEYRYSERIDGTKHFGVWPLSEAAHACFGTQQWPATHPIPQATIEFEVEDVEAAAAELHEQGHGLVHEVRTEPWGQVIARFQSADGLLLGVCSTPHLAHA